MSQITEILENYSKENHNNFLYENIKRIEFKIHPLKSDLWNNASLRPNIAISHLLDSYSCLSERPDMAFTFLWKSINYCYKKIATKKILNSNNTGVRLNDSQGLDDFAEKIESIKNENIFPNLTILDLLKEYAKLIQLKPCKFLSNHILKGYVMKQAGIPNFMIGSTYSSFKSSNSDLHNKIVSTYGEAYKSISNPRIQNYEVDLQISDLLKSKSITQSLAEKLQILIVNGTVDIQNRNHSQNINLRISNDKKLIELLLKTILYTIRNNSVHGNVVSRLNSAYANDESLKTAIYIYFLGHYFLSLGLYCNQEIELEDLQVNVSNLELLKTLL